MSSAEPTPAALRVATLREGGPDGLLVAVDAGLERVAPIAGPDPADPDSSRATLQAALDDWERWEPVLAAACAALDRGEEPEGVRPYVPGELDSPLPRAYVWAEGSTYLSHMRRCRAARGAEMPPGAEETPIVYHGGSGRFLPPTGELEAGDPAWDLDLEATVAVVVDDVPRGTDALAALAHIKLVLLVNDLTFRALLPAEAATGVGLFTSKPERPCAPVAVSPAALGSGWRGDRLASSVRCEVRGERLGELRSEDDCRFGFGELIERMTLTRELRAGTVVGAGTVSNEDARRGYGCIAELRASEILADGEPSTPYLTRGDRVRIEALDADRRSTFGALDHVIA